MKFNSIFVTDHAMTRFHQRVVLAKGLDVEIDLAVKQSKIMSRKKARIWIWAYSDKHVYSLWNDIIFVLHPRPDQRFDMITVLIKELNAVRS